MIEVQAQLSFDQFRMGKFYQVDGSDPRIQNQVYAGYFKVINVLEDGNVGTSADMDSSAGAGTSGDLGSGNPPVAKRKPGRPKKETVTNGAGGDLPGEGDSLHTSGDLAASVQNGQPDS